MPVYERLDHRDVEKLMELVNKLQATTKRKEYKEMDEEVRRKHPKNPRYLWREVEEICRKAEETVRRDPMVVNNRRDPIVTAVFILTFVGFITGMAVLLISTLNGCL